MSYSKASESAALRLSDVHIRTAVDSNACSVPARVEGVVTCEFIEDCIQAEHAVSLLARVLCLAVERLRRTLPSVTFLEVEVAALSAALNVPGRWG